MTRKKPARKIYVAHLITDDPDLQGEWDCPSEEFWPVEFFVNLRRESCPTEKWKIVEFIEATKERKGDE